MFRQLSWLTAEERTMLVNRPKNRQKALFAAGLFLCAALSAHACADDPNYPWNLGPNGINAAAAWDAFGVDGNGVKIAIIDSGVDYNAAELSGAKYLGGYDFCSTGTAYSCSGEDADPKDEYGHGTEMASAILSTTYGAAPNAEYYAVKVGNDDGQSSVYVLEKALEWAILTEPNIIYTGIKSYGYQTIDELIIAAYSKGVVLVAPTYGYPWGIPAIAPQVIGVGSHTKGIPQEVLYGTTYTPPNTLENASELLGPGEEIAVLGLDGSQVYADDNVGVAAAQVAGALALMVEYNKENNKGYSNSAFRRTLWQGAVDLETGDPREGYGKVDVFNALTLMANDWFIDCSAQFLTPDFYEAGLPGYFNGETLDYNVVLTNNVEPNFTGYRDIDDLTVTVSLRYDGHDANAIIDVNAIDVFNIDLPEGQTEELAGSYSIPSETLEGNIALDVNIVVGDWSWKPEALIRHSTAANAVIRTPCGQEVDFVPDNIVDLYDLSFLAQWWKMDCNELNDWCEEVDVITDGTVDLYDLQQFASCWLCRYP